MLSFLNDYSEGAHPRILKALADTNLDQTCGYGLDSYCQRAAELIRQKCAAPEADVHFVVGGTQANLLVIHALLRSFEAAIAADTGHINVHETGAIEATGHKVCTVPSPDGKLTPALVRQVVDSHSSEHMVRPRLVYISDTTEIGTFYTKAELAALRRCCDENGLLMYLDGARLGSALTAEGSDLTLSDLAALTDAFTIGGTKNGALFGEAIILKNAALQPDFRSYIKQRGAMLAKGRLLGIQFTQLLTDDLYFDMGRHANAMAAQVRDALLAEGYPCPYDSHTNQIFPILPHSVIEKLSKVCAFEVSRPEDETHSMVRFVTSWATTEEAVKEFAAVLPTCR
jgi:threonine aldolase